MKDREPAGKKIYKKNKLKNRLDELYGKYNHRKFIHPDPLEFLYGYNDLRNREIVGLVSSSLAYGRVAQILKSVNIVLDKMNPSPYSFILETGPEYLEECFKDFSFN